MSPTLTDAGVAASDPSDGLAVLEQRGSKAETFGIPLAVLQSGWKVSEVDVAEVGASDHLAFLAESVRTENPTVLEPVFERARDELRQSRDPATRPAGECPWRDAAPP